MEKITEIAVLLHDGTRVTDEFITLVNPDKKIPYRITQLTGINNRMTDGAPRFYEIARTLIELTKDRVIVGHNVSFDYNFIRAEFGAFGYHFERKTLCTCKLSRQLISGKSSYGLGNLCRELGIENSSRHRAAGDAYATVKLFEMLLGIQPRPENLPKRNTASDTAREMLIDVPHKTGVYYLLNSRQEIIYVGKSNNIYDRILQHLNNNTTRKGIEMQGNIAAVNWELTGSELVALLLESEEIKRLKPLYNRSQRRSIFNYGLFDYVDEQGYLCLKIQRNTADLTPLTSYTGLKEAREHLTEFATFHGLCHKLCGLSGGKGACFQFHIKNCKGACIGVEPPTEYNERFTRAIATYEFKHRNFYLLDTGRQKDENSIIKVENGKYIGFGFANLNELQGQEALDGCIRRYADNRDVQTILKSWMRRNRFARVIPF